MAPTEHVSEWSRSPEAIDTTIADHRGPLILDLDETLYLRNSTEDFIDTAAPGLAGRLLFLLLDLLRPWLLTGGRLTRDAWRIRLAALVPGAMRRWRARVASLAAAATNEPLRALALERKDAVIATLGFVPVVRPLLDAMRLGEHRLVASRMGSFADRRDGKLARLEAELGAKAVRQALVVTDSLDDRDLLAVCAQPLLVRWPAARFVPAHSGTYLPLEYTHRIKRPNLGYVRRSILGDDYALWIVASITVATFPLTQAAGLMLLILSFWTIYELGYIDNDAIAERYEAAPVLTSAYRQSPVATAPLQAWLWASALGVAGIACIERTMTPPVASVGAWLLVLLALHAVYLVYNRVDKGTRVWLYSLLQLGRASAFVAVVPVPVIGALALAAHAISRWITYFVYRTTGRAWPEDIPQNVVRFVLFVMMAIPVHAAGGLMLDAVLTTLLITTWFAFRAGPRMLAIPRNARLIWWERRGKQPSKA